MDSIFVVGLMSGTSADGIDAVVAEIPASGPAQAKVRAHQHIPFTSDLQEHILEVCLEGTVSDVCALNFELGERFAAAALSVIGAAKLGPEQILAIGSHGQTIHHLPPGRVVYPSEAGRVYPHTAGPHGSTLQIGEPGVIAERTGITTVADFRVRDVAAGGQGAPLVPFADWALFTSPTETRIIQNIGGIGNLTVLPPKATIQDVVAFDTGPGNMVIDGLMRRISAGKETYDQDGRRAARGRIHEGLLVEMMKHPFLERMPPKTTGREEFGEEYIGQIHLSASLKRIASDDLIATATEFTAASIEDACRRFVFPALEKHAVERESPHSAQGQRELKTTLIVGGGGAKNPTLMAALKRRLAPIEVFTHESFGVQSEAKEALAFAILAWQTMQGLPGNVPRATGASKYVVLGNITPGHNLQRWPVTLSASSSAG